MAKRIDYRSLVTAEAPSKAAIYVRVSTHWQIDKDSLAVQKKELIAYADMVLGIKDYVIFEDAGYSAKNTERPDYQGMMLRLRSGEFSHLLVWKIDRISRNLLDFSEMYAELKSLGIAFVSKNEQFDTSTAIGEAMLKIILVFAELERNMTSERVSAVMLSRANSGKWNGGQVPFGYSYEKETESFPINPVENKIYNIIVEMYEKTDSIYSVVRYLNNNDIPAKRGGTWSIPSVWKILSSPWYIGIYTYNVRNESNGWEIRDKSEWISIENHHVPSIQKERWERIQTMLKQNKRGGNKKGQAYVAKNIHIFSGMVRCGICGSNMSAGKGTRRKDGWRPSYYGCARRRVNPADCTNKFVSDVTLVPFVLGFISNTLRARDIVTKDMDLENLQDILLAGDQFSSVKAIEKESLIRIHTMLMDRRTGMEYEPPLESDVESVADVELASLRSRKQKYENALGRLKSLYLYSEDGMPEKDFIIEKQRITTDILATEKRINELELKATGKKISEKEFIAKASYFIMAEKLMNDGAFDYLNYIKMADPQIPKDFLRSVISTITVAMENVESIVFRNGIRCDFIY